MNSLLAFSEELEALVARVTPAVVGIERGNGHGTGFVLAGDGYVLTNHHVAGTARTLVVRTEDGDTLKGELVGSDPQTDLAVIKVIEGPRLTPLPLAESHPIAVGQLVVAVGNPYGFERSVSVGIISALDRSLPGPRGHAFEGLVQTDAAINPGNSGGPLVNARAEVVGINTAVIPYAQGMGFAVGARTALWVAGELIHRGFIRRRNLGIAARSVTLSARRAESMGQARAVHVLRVANGSPADRAGVNEADHVLAVHGQAVASVDDVHRLLVLEDRAEVELVVFSRGKRRTLTVRPELQKAA